jgi:type VI secretion system secreted protein Hcp
MKNILNPVRLILLITVLLAGTSAQAAVEMFLVLGDKIKGESKDKQYGPKGASDVLAWSWGMSQSGTTHSGAGGGAGKASFQDLSLTKWMDTATPGLMNALAKGTHIEQVVLTVRKPGEPPQKYIEITMNDVMVTSISTGASSGEDRITENISLNFAKVTFEYFTQDKAGKTTSGGKFGWNIAENKGN